MQNQLKGGLYYLTADIRRTLVIFWSILLGLLLVSFLTNVIFFGTTFITYELSFPTYVFAAIIGQITVQRTIPHLIKMGSTRLNVFKSIGTYFFGLALFNTVLANTVHSVTMYLFGSTESGQSSTFSIAAAGEQTRTFNHIADFFGNVWWSRMLIDFSISYLLLACGFILGLVFYRFGIIGGFAFLAALVFTFILGMTQGWLLQFFIDVFQNISLLFFVQLFLVGIVIYLVSFVLIRRISVS